MSKITDEVFKIAKPIVKANGLELIELDYLKEGSDWILKVFIDNPDGNLNLDHCEKVSKSLSQELDRCDPIDSSYLLEVSSPGLDRPLKSKKDYEKYIGENILITTYAPYQGSKEFEGKLIDFNDKNVIIKTSCDKGVIEIPFSKIANAKLTIDF